MKRDIGAKIIIAVIALFVGITAGYLFIPGESGGEGGSASVEKEQIWTCSMHPQIRKNEPGQCPICGMDLIPLEESKGTSTDPLTFTMGEEAAALANIQVRAIDFSLPTKEMVLQGKVEVDETNLSLVTARFPGRIEKLYINYTGQQVRRGQRLAALYSPELIAAQQELFEAMTLEDISPELLNAAKMKLKLWGLTDGQIQNIVDEGEPLETVDILSPQTGVVLERKATLGEYIKEGTVLFKVANLSEVWVEFDAYESEIPWLNVGDPISFTISSLPGTSFKEDITFVDPFVDPATRTAKVRVELSNADGKIKPSMYATARVEAKLPIDKARLTIPKSAVLWTGKRSVVYVYKDDKGQPSFQYREITLGPDLGAEYIVEDGVEAGEEVVVNGTFKVDAAAQLAGQKSMMNKPVVGRKPDNTHDHSKMDHDAHFHSTLRVQGDCGMCKKRIEDVANNFDGVLMAEWNPDSQVLTIHHEKKDLLLDPIAKAIAEAGHSNELHTASPESYESLPKCCRYTDE